MSNTEEDKDKKVDERQVTNNIMEAQQLLPAAAIAPLSLKETNMCVTWKLWKNQFKIFLRASNLEQQSDQRKVALLLHHLGPDSLQIFTSFNLDMDVVEYETLLTYLDSYFIPKANIAMERHVFFSRKQANHESIEEYVTVLKNLSTSCDFGELREGLVKDIFVCGLLPSFFQIKERLLSEGNITLQKAIDLAKSINSAKENASQLQQETHFISALNKTHANYNYKKSLSSNNSSSSSHGNQRQYNYQYLKSLPPPPKKLSSSNSQQQCSRCGEFHRERCPAEYVNCHI